MKNTVNSLIKLDSKYNYQTKSELLIDKTTLKNLKLISNLYGIDCSASQQTNSIRDYFSAHFSSIKAFGKTYLPKEDSAFSLNPEVMTLPNLLRLSMLSKKYNPSGEEHSDYITTNVSSYMADCLKELNSPFINILSNAVAYFPFRLSGFKPISLGTNVENLIGQFETMIFTEKQKAN